MTLSLSNHLGADSAYRALSRDVVEGLQSTPKSLPPKWFYDSVGSDLFDQITRLHTTRNRVTLGKIGVFGRSCYSIKRCCKHRPVAV